MGVKLRERRWVGHVVSMGQTRKALKNLVRKPEGKRSLGRPWGRLEDNIRLDPRETGCEGVDRMHLAQNKDQ
jgi:hypothetical protein